jgi:hypothetical protein
MKGQTDQDDFPGTTQRDDTMGHMTQMSVDNEDGQALIGTLLLEFCNARQKNCLNRVDEENCRDKHSWSRPNGVIMALVQFMWSECFVERLEVENEKRHMLNRPMQKASSGELIANHRALQGS